MGSRRRDGHRVRWGALVRSDLPTRLTDTGRQTLVAHGIRTILDLRFPGEIARDWDAYPFQDDAGRASVSYVNVPFNHGRDPELDEQVHAAYRSATSRQELNRHDIDWNQIGIATAVAAIADAQPAACWFTAMPARTERAPSSPWSLSMLGVADEDIADDYALTALSIEPLIVEWLDESSSNEEERAHLRALAMPVREAMLDTLAYMRERHGSAEAFLRGGGVTADQIGALRARLLEDA